MNRMRIALTLAGLALVGASVPVAAQSGARAVDVKDNVYIPKDISVPVGTTVTWTNSGRSPHNVVAGDRSRQSGNLDPGASYRITFDKAQTWFYYCTYHSSGTGSGMAGVIRVGSGGPVIGAPKKAGTAPSPAGPAVRRVPKDYPTIQKAIDAARPGDVVLVYPGVYKESVKITKPDITLRGTDRNKVIVDGEFTRAMGVLVQDADNVVVENMTARHTTLNNFYWTDVDGFAGRYLTSYNSGDYGIYSFASANGVFEDSWASGSRDSGFYIGQCKDCRQTIQRIKATLSGLGYSGTNAGGHLVIKDSEWWDNFGGGITPNTLDSEENPPQRDAVITNNYVHGNHNRSAPYKDPAFASVYGVGIALMGVVDDVVTGNRVEDHEYFGILAMGIPGLGAGAAPTGNIYPATGNKVRDNKVSGSGVADIALGAPSGAGNCFSGNAFGTSLPPAIETLYSCDGGPLSPVGGGDAAVSGLIASNLARAESGELAPGDWKTQAPPPPQPNMPNAEVVTFRPAGTAPIAEAIDDPTVGTGGEQLSVLPKTGGRAPYRTVGLALLALAGLWGLASAVRFRSGTIQQP